MSELHQGVLVNPTVVSPFRSQKREDYVTATEQEVMEWMTDRHEEMKAAPLMSGNPTGMEGGDRRLVLVGGSLGETLFDSRQIRSQGSSSAQRSSIHSVGKFISGSEVGVGPVPRWL